MGRLVAVRQYAPIKQRIDFGARSTYYFWLSYLVIFRL